ncbi:twin-arginine translocase TatA/TatE family subunit [Streptomyces sp. NPDC016566]|uniref:twin-arginine translocase TatA/TatE family subunit n=1 Tax=unclassified Streptomyces TaxID=2593676 RepID=UPI0021BD7623|nr:twin-arginine translocase TatA/TatE family subunit [Streptomyces sp. BK340]
MFGSKKLPEAARGLGKSMRILKSEAKAMKDDGVAQSAPPADGAPEQSAPKVIQTAPGEAAAARTVAEEATAR